MAAVRDCLIADNCLQRRYSTRNYRASLTRIGLPPIHQACLERVQHLAATARRRREAIEAMVFFVCEDCNETLKRLKVAQHLCRCSCSAITCVDCGATFHDDSYLQHATCMSEAERYEGNLYKAPKKKTAQDAWAELVQSACADRKDAPPAAAKLLPRLQGFENIPRNQKKFCNWVKNSLNLRGGDAAAVDALWSYLVARRDAARAEAAPVAPAPAPVAAPPAEKKKKKKKDKRKRDETPEERKARKLRKKMKKAKKKQAE